jgi:hypothetical protein
MKVSYILLSLSTALYLICVQPADSMESDIDYSNLSAFKILSLPKSWFDTTPVYKEPKLLFYTQEFTQTCSECHIKDLKSEPKKSHLPFGAHKDMLFTHGLNLRCLNCHHADHPDAFTDHDGSVISKDNPVLLCRKCHGVTYRDWLAGVHGRINSFWNAKYGTKKNLECNQCHNPHHPKFPDLKPMAPPAHPTSAHHEEVRHHE